MNRIEYRDRVVRVPLRRQDMGRLFTGELAVVDRLPEGAQYWGGYVDDESRMLYLYFSHEQFPKVEEGEEIPVFEIEVQPIENV